MRQTRNYLFREHDYFGVQRATTQAMLDEIARYDSDRLLNTNTDDLITYFVDKHKIDIPVLLEEHMQLDAQESNRDVSAGRRSDYGYDSGPVIVAGTHITLEVPFSGDPDLFKIQPSTYSSMPPTGTVRGQILILDYWSESPDPNQFTAAKDKWLADIKQYLQWHHQTFDGFNQSLPTQASEAVEARKQKLLSSQNMVAALGIPLKRSSNHPQTFSAPEVKRKIVQPPSSKGAYVAEPVLEENEYQHILGIMDNMVHVMERSPKDFHNMGEETLRSHFLVQLNSQYEGKASAETFNYEGKTDILIRSGDKNIFIAECKFWGGQKMLTETIDQLLGYLTWRDSKAAILIFNRNKDFLKFWLLFQVQFMSIQTAKHKNLKVVLVSVIHLDTKMMLQNSCI